MPSITFHARQRRRRIAAAVIGVVFALLPAACSFDNGDSDSDDAGQTLRIGITSLEGENWSPNQGPGGAERAVVYAVYDRLINVDFETRNYKPGLATSWTPNDDYTEWTFKLRDDVPFQKGPDGQDYGMLTAEDVKFSYSLAIADDSTLARADTYRGLIDNNLDNFEIVDDHTFVLHLPEANAIVPSYFTTATASLAITSEKYWNEVGEQAATDHPIGTGPWKFDSFKSGDSVTLSAVQNHWNKTPEFSKMIIKIIPDPAAQLAALKTGDIDFAAIGLDLVPEAKAANLRVISVPNTGVSSLYFGGEYPGSEFYDKDAPWIQADDPAKGKLVRQAISMAIDREGIVDNLLLGQATPIIGPIHFVPGIPATDPAWVKGGDQMPAFDPDKAKELLAEGGYPDGFSAHMLLPPMPGSDFAGDITQAIQSQLAEIGIKTDLRPVTDADWDKTREDRATQGSLFMYIQPVLALEPADRFSAFVPDDAGAEFFDPDIEPFVAQMKQEPDFDKRMAIARELGQTMIDEVGPAIGIAAINQQWVAGSRIGDWQNIAGVTELHNTEYMTPAKS